MIEETFDRKDPNGADEYFLHCVRNGDLKGAMSCFDPEAVYIGRDGQPVKGLANIEKAVAMLCSMRPDIKVYQHESTMVGDNMIYWLDKWTMTGTDPEGNPIDMKGASANMMRRDMNGMWLWLVDNPFAELFFSNEDK